MHFSTYLSLALATAVLAAPQQDGDRRACPSTTTTTIRMCTATTSILPTTTCTKRTVTRCTATTSLTPSPTTVTVTTTATPTCPATQLIEIVGFGQNLCGNTAVSQTGIRPDVQVVSLTPPPTNSQAGSCQSFTNGQVSSLLFKSVPNNLLFAANCRLIGFRGVGCNAQNGFVSFDLAQAQRGLCQDPEGFDDINSVQIRCDLS